MMTLTNFLQSTDLHGVRFIADNTISFLRRLVWFIVFLASTIGLLVLIIIRVQYFHTYPTVNNIVFHSDFLPAPAVAICRHGNQLPIYVPRADDFTGLAGVEEYLQNFTDVDFTYFLYFGMEINIFSKAEGGLFKIDPDSFWVFDYFVDIALSQVIAKRIQGMDKNITINPEKSLISFLERHALINPVFRTGGAKCLVRLDGESVSNDCNWTQVMSRNGPCLIFNHDGGLVFKIQDDGFRTELTLFLYDIFVPEYEYIWTRTPLKKEFIDLQVKMLDPKDFPEMSFVYLQHIFEKSEVDQYLEIEISKSYYSKELDKPYNERPCSKLRHSYCVKECVAKRMPCRPLMLHLDKYKPFCDLDQQWNFFLQYNQTVLDACKLECPRSCESTRYKMVKTIGNAVDAKYEYFDYVANYYDNLDYDETLGRFIVIKLSPAPGSNYEEYFQESQYSVGALVAEVGGFIGLFLGASTLTLYHWLEYAGIRLTQFFTTRPTKMRKRRARVENL